MYVVRWISTKLDNVNNREKPNWSKTCHVCMNNFGNIHTLMLFYFLKKWFKCCGGIFSGLPVLFWRVPSCVDFTLAEFVKSVETTTTTHLPLSHTLATGCLIWAPRCVCVAIQFQPNHTWIVRGIFIWT